MTGAPGLDYLSPRRLQGHVLSVFAYPLPADGGLSLRPGSNVLFPFVADDKIIMSHTAKSTIENQEVLFWPSKEKGFCLPTML